MIIRSRKGLAIAAVGALVLAVQLVRAPTIAVTVASIFAATWFVRRFKHRHLDRSSWRRVRREVITVALITASAWLGGALALTAWELSMHPVQVGEAETEAIFQYWPWAFMIDGFAVDTGLAYLMLALAFAKTGPKRRRRRRRPRPELAPVKVESDPLE